MRPPSQQKPKKLIPPNHSPENDEFLAGARICPSRSRDLSRTSPAAVPHRPDRRLGPAGAKTAAVPAPAVEARVAVPVLGAAARPRQVIVPFDPAGRAGAGQETIPMPGANPLGLRGGGRFAHGKRQGGGDRQQDHQMAPLQARSCLRDGSHHPAETFRAARPASPSRPPARASRLATSPARPRAVSTTRDWLRLPTPAKSTRRSR